VKLRRAAQEGALAVGSEENTASVASFPLVRAKDPEVVGLVAVIRRLAAARTLPEVTDVVTHAVRTLLKADGAAFVLRDGDYCVHAAEDVIAPLWAGRRVPLSASISGWCMLHDQAVAIADVSRDPRIQASYKATFVKSLAVAPVRHDAPVAALGAYWAQVHEVSPEQLELLETIANASALAVSAAHLGMAAETRYRAVFNQAAVGVARVSPTGDFLEVNDRFCQITGHQREDLLATGFPAITYPEDLEPDFELMHALLAGEIETFTMEKRYVRKDGGVVWARLTASLARCSDGSPDYFISVIEDITAQKEAAAEERARAEEFHALADNIPILCFMAYPDANVYWYNRQWYDYTGTAPGSSMSESWKRAIAPEIILAVRERFRRCQAAGEAFEMTFPLVRHDGAYRPFLTRIVPIHGEDGRIVRWFGCSTDVAEQHEHEEHLKLLLNELNHRVKNTLATVQSIAAQTLRGARDPGEVFERFEARLLGLSSAHNILTERNWEGAPLAEIARQTISPFLPNLADRVHVAGPEVWLPPGHAVALALAFHELATNAVKHGSLSDDRGAVKLTWTLEEDGPELRLTWAEVGGPLVVPPTRRGFGSRLIERSLARELGGPTSLRFEPDGLICDIRAALRTPLPTH
jgi:PAS domain S-box-containing protein